MIAVAGADLDGDPRLGHLPVADQPPLRDRCRQYQLDLFLGVLYGAAAILYVVARLSGVQGVDLDAIHAQIPAE